MIDEPTEAEILAAYHESRRAYKAWKVEHQRACANGVTTEWQGKPGSPLAKAYRAMGDAQAAWSAMAERQIVAARLREILDGPEPYIVDMAHHKTWDDEFRPTFKREDAKP